MAVSVSDYREAARRRLPKPLFDYVDGGSFSESTLEANVADFAGVKLRQRVMRDVSALDTAVTLFGRKMAMPVVLAPVGFAGMMARRGETQAARAAQAAGVPFTLSTVGICSIAEVRAATADPFWFQLYMMKDRGFISAMLQAAQDAGCGALVFTVDLAVLGTRYRDLRNVAAGRAAAASAYLSRLPWVWDVGVNGRPHVFGNLAGYVKGGNRLADLMAWTTQQLDPKVTWADIAWVRQVWKGPLIVKGVLDPDDARAAADAGADGIVVSNHGGRQLDGAPSSIAALPAVAQAVRGRITVLMDGGVRSGADVAKAMASGAHAVMIGRPWVYALAAGGEGGVRAILATLQAELRTAMALMGAVRASDIGRDSLA